MSEAVKLYRELEVAMLKARERGDEAAEERLLEDMDVVWYRDLTPAEIGHINGDSKPSTRERPKRGILTPRKLAGLLFTAGFTVLLTCAVI